MGVASKPVALRPGAAAPWCPAARRCGQARTPGGDASRPRRRGCAEPGLAGRRVEAVAEPRVGRAAVEPVAARLGRVRAPAVRVRDVGRPLSWPRVDAAVASSRALPSRGCRGRRSSSLRAAPLPPPPLPTLTSSSRGSASPSRRPVGDADPRAAETRRRRWWRWWCSERRIDDVCRQTSRRRHPRCDGRWRRTARRRAVRSLLGRRRRRRVPNRRLRLYAQ